MQQPNGMWIKNEQGQVIVAVLLQQSQKYAII